jgi:hypothetical protein
MAALTIILLEMQRWKVTSRYCSVLEEIHMNTQLPQGLMIAGSTENAFETTLTIGRRYTVSQRSGPTIPLHVIPASIRQILPVRSLATPAIVPNILSSASRNLPLPKQDQTQPRKLYRHAADAYSATFTEAVISSTSNGNDHQISIHRNHDGSTIDRVGFRQTCRFMVRRAHY